MRPFTLANEAVRQAAIRAIRAAPVGWRVTIEEPKRSDPQNRRMWAALGDISRQIEWHGEYLSAEDWKTMLTASFRKCRVIPGLDAGTLVPLGLSTSSMSKSQLSSLTEFAYAFGCERGVRWTDPTFARDAA